MNLSVLLLLMAMLLTGIYFLGRARSLALANRHGGRHSLNSLPYYYGLFTVLWTGIPALALLTFWFAFDDRIIAQIVSSHFPQALLSAGKADVGLALNMALHY